MAPSCLGGKHGDAGVFHAAVGFLPRRGDFFESRAIVPCLSPVFAGNPPPYGHPAEGCRGRCRLSGPSYPRFPPLPSTRLSTADPRLSRARSRSSAAAIHQRPIPGSGLDAVPGWRPRAGGERGEEGAGGNGGGIGATGQPFGTPAPGVRCRMSGAKRPAPAGVQGRPEGGRRTGRRCPGTLPEQ